MSKPLISPELYNLKHNQKLLAILILLLVCVIFWIAISLFTSQQRTAISPKLIRYSQPLTPVLDDQTLSLIEQKKKYSESELNDFPIYILTNHPERREEVIMILQNRQLTTIVPPNFVDQVEDEQAQNEPAIQTISAPGPATQGQPATSPITEDGSNI